MKKDVDPEQKPWHNVSIDLKQAFCDELCNVEKCKWVIKMYVKHMQTNWMNPLINVQKKEKISYVWIQ